MSFDHVRNNFVFAVPRKRVSGLVTRDFSVSSGTW